MNVSVNRVTQEKEKRASVMEEKEEKEEIKLSDIKQIVKLS